MRVRVNVIPYAGHSRRWEGNLSMKWIFCCMLVMLFCLFPSCRDQKKYIHPGAVLKRWAGAIRDLHYLEYSRCEAYPKNEAVFREMYRDYYIIDLMITDFEEVDEDAIKQDQDGNRFLQRSISFEGALVSRMTNKPEQILRGDALLVKFLDGERAKDDWLLWNRTLVRIDRKR